MAALEPDIAKFCTAMDKAVAERHLPDPSQTAGILGQNQTDTEAYAKALRARLIDLGYLGESERNRKQSEIDGTMGKAIKRFQRDAELLDEQCTVDGWAGPVTWKVLECLVSIENKQSPANWPLQNRDGSNPAVLRATYLRLYIMGFFEDWKADKPNTRTVFDPGSNPKFKQAIARFSNFLAALGLRDSDLEQQLDTDFLERLFCHDELIKRMASTNENSLFADFADAIEAISRIELWLFGYDVTPGAPRKIKVKRRGSGKKAAKFQMLPAGELAIKAFWRDNPEVQPSDVDNKLATQPLFTAFVDLLESNASNVYVGKQVAVKVQEALKSRSAKKSLLDNLARLANGIWDGVKRLAKWLCRMFRKAVKMSLDLIANLARFLSKQSRRLFVDVTKALHVVHSSLTYLRGGVHASSKTGVLAISTDKDFDHSCLIDPTATSEQRITQLDKYQLHRLIYAAGTRVISALIKVFGQVRNVVLAASGPLTWILALVSLARLWNSLKAISKELELVRQYEMNVVNPQSLVKTQIT